MTENTPARKRRIQILPISVFAALAIFFLDFVLPMDFSFDPFGVYQERRKLAADRQAFHLHKAIATYITEYRKWPVILLNEPQAENTWIFSDQTLMDILMGAESENGLNFNPNRLSFFAERKARGNPPKAGVVIDAVGGGELFDPWGNHYRVLIDLDRNDQVPAPDWAKDQTPIPQTVIVWSPGPDGKDETEDDNITTW